MLRAGAIVLALWMPATAFADERPPPIYVPADAATRARIEAREHARDEQDVDDIIAEDELAERRRAASAHRESVDPGGGGLVSALRRDEGAGLVGASGLMIAWWLLRRRN